MGGQSPPPPAPPSPAPIADLSPEAFVDSSPSWPLLDVRSAVEFSRFHAPGALHLSLPRLVLGRSPRLRPWALPPWFQALPRDQPIAVICLTAHRSPLAARALAAMGFTQIFNISGGMRAWRQAGLPTQQGPFSPPGQP